MSDVSTASAALPPAWPGTAAPPITPAMPSHKPPVQLVYDGKLGELYVIYLRALLLTLLTLGWYRFWGRTSVRRYLWSHFSAFGDRFEYRGLGIELFLGFLMAIGSLLVFEGAVLGVVWLAWGDELPAEIGMTDIMTWALILVGLPLLPVAQYAGWRYRFTRTAWRGIRTGLKGSSWTYGAMALGWGLVNAMCMNLITPVRDVSLNGYRTRHMTFGNLSFGFAGRAADIYGRFIGFYFLNIVAWVVLFIVVAIIIGGVSSAPGSLSFEQMMEKLAHPTPMVLLVFFAVLLGFYTLVGVMILPVRCWWMAYSVRYMVSRAWFDRLQFVTGVTTRQIWGFLVLNYLILLFTLGLGGPWVMHRTARLIARQLWIYGEIDPAAVAQALGGATGVGEGLLDVFDVGGV
ncbi:MAG: YjgN family protein [Reyranellaceae bacterium]